MKSSDAKEETKKEEKQATEAHAATQPLTVIEGKSNPMFFQCLVLADTIPIFGSSQKSSSTWRCWTELSTRLNHDIALECCERLRLCGRS
jgi:hypothetical protein